MCIRDSPMGLSQGVNFISGDLNAHRQLAKTAKTNAPVALGYAGRRDPGKALEQRIEGDAGFHARDVHARAGVVAVAEGDVAVGLAADVEAVGVGELRRVAVGRADAEGNEGALGEAPVSY